MKPPLSCSSPLYLPPLDHPSPLGLHVSGCHAVDICVQAGPSDMAFTASRWVCLHHLHPLPPSLTCESSSSAHAGLYLCVYVRSARCTSACLSHVQISQIHICLLFVCTVGRVCAVWLSSEEGERCGPGASSASQPKRTIQTSHYIPICHRPGSICMNTCCVTV